MSRKRPGDNPRPLAVEWDVEAPFEALVDRVLLEQVLGEAFSGKNLGSALAVGLLVTDDVGIRALNRDHRGMDTPTDVLSFPLLDFEAPGQPGRLFPSPPGEPLHLGDVVVSYQRAVAQASEYGHSLARELAFLAVHGALHLLGYDHEEPADAERMRREEEAVLQRLGLGREA